MTAEPLLTVDLALERLGRGTTVVIALFEQLPDAFARWRPSQERWSLLEIINHLGDEEALDFRARIESTLRDPSASWPPIAPQDWVQAKNYNGRDPGESLERFLTERRRSLDWLRTQRGAPWHNAYVHPKLGAMSAQMLLANWVAHDFLHGRQMLRLHYEHLALLATPHALDYAGAW